MRALAAALLVIAMVIALLDRAAGGRDGAVTGRPERGLAQAAEQGAAAQPAAQLAAHARLDYFAQLERARRFDERHRRVDDAALLGFSVGALLGCSVGALLGCSVGALLGSSSCPLAAFGGCNNW
jgi:hypothetical protein